MVRHEYDNVFVRTCGRRLKKMEIKIHLKKSGVV